MLDVTIAQPKSTMNTTVSSENKDLSHLLLNTLLIMILENAIKHGVEPTSKKVTVEFKITVSNNILTLFSSNSILTNNNSEHGVGLNNLRRRLTLLYPNKHTLIIYKNNTLWQTTLKLELAAC